MQDKVAVKHKILRQWQNNSRGYGAASLSQRQRKYFKATKEMITIRSALLTEVAP